MVSLFRRREMVQAGDGKPKLKNFTRTSKPAFKITAPNHIEMGANSSNQPFFNLREPEKNGDYTGATDGNMKAISGTSVWFTIPANTNCQLKAVNCKYSSSSGAGKLRLMLRPPGDYTMGQWTGKYFDADLTPAAYTAASGSSKSVSFTPGADYDVYTIWVRGNITPKYISFDLELWVGGEQWI